MTVPLVAVAHGSRDPRAMATIEELLGLVRCQGPETRVVASYLDHSAPAPAQVLGGLAGEGVGEAVVLPLLLGDAYHSKVDIPGVLAKVRATHPGLRLRYGSALGPHPLLLDVLERRLAETGIEPDPGTAVVLASAGSSDPVANAAIARLARQWKARSDASTAPAIPRPATEPKPTSERWWDVIPAYASAARPAPAAAIRGLREAGATRVVVASFLLAPGLFADKIRHESRAAGASAVSPVLGAAPELASIVLDRYAEALRASEQLRITA